MKEKQRIGILGGTFNPPHIGHLILAEEALTKLNLDKVIFIPTYVPPHKSIKENNAYVRYKMVGLACMGNPKFETSKIELERRRVSYSVETLRKLRDKYGKAAKLFFIAGSDLVDELESWKDIEEVLKLANFIIAKRPGFPVRKFRNNISIIEIPDAKISSSMIRSRLRRSRTIRYLVPESVRLFIIKRGLYK